MRDTILIEPVGDEIGIVGHDLDWLHFVVLWTIVVCV
jgi:hypothetical protein